jgi:menaquinone-dependent protoporphyrinogen oxidase
MCAVPIFFATTEGQTRRIAQRLAVMLNNRGVASEAIDVQSTRVKNVDWAHVRAVAVGASVHAGRHQQEIEQFIRVNRDQLAASPSLFFSVSLRAASSKPADLDAARDVVETLIKQTGWQPQQIVCVAGRLAYRQYGFFMKLVMRHLAKKGGLATDTSRDHDYTDWTQITRLADELAARTHQSVDSAQRVAS